MTRTITEVEELEETSIDSSTYEIPAGFQQVQMMPQSEQQEGGGFGGLFGRKPEDG